MASKIELSRGNLLGKKLEGFGSAELFWEAKSNGEDSQFKKWNEGTLWIGRPEVDGSNSEKNVAIPIAGGRIHNSLVYRGLLANERNKLDEKFKHARVGDFYVWDNRARHDLEEDNIESALPTDTFRNLDDFRKGDILLIYSITGDDIPADQETNIDPNTGCLISQDLIRYLRINNSGGTAKDTSFVTENGQPFKQWEATNVEAALLELQFEKTEYVKVINSMSDWPNDPVIGGLYLIGVDNLNLINTEYAPDSLKIIHPDKGDFILYTRNTLYEDGKLDDDKKKYSAAYYWQLIPSGFTNADELDYYDNDRAQQKENFINRVLNPEKHKTTFSEKHVSDFSKNADTIHSALDFLMENKAMLDENGKVPLSQLHDTVLGAMQYKGTWIPYNLTEEQLHSDDIVIWDKDHTTCHLSENKYYHKLPGFERYEAGILDPNSTEDVSAVQNGDYYIVKEDTIIYNLQYPCDQTTIPELWELNTGDWIVFQGKGNIDTESGGVITETTDGFWTVLDNTDRLKAINFYIDTSEDGDFWTTDLTNPEERTFVGAPVISASHKIGITNKSHNAIEIVGDGLISQKRKENSITSYYPRYINDKGEVENSYIQDIKSSSTETPADIHSPTTENKTIIHSNVEIGAPIALGRLPEQRLFTTFGDFMIKPHVDVSTGLQKEIKSIAKFYVYNAADELIPFNVIAPDGTDTRQSEIKEDIAASTASEVNLVLPEKSSTLLGKLAGIELEDGRITKSIIEGYEESSSIEEHINTSEHDTSEDSEDINDLRNKHFHDEIHNIVELHSQLSAPVQNTYEIYFGKYHVDAPKDSYTAKDFNSSGALAEDIVARLTRNQYTEETNIEILLPCHSGTLLLQEDIISLFGHDDDTYLPMFGQTQTLDKEGKRFNILQRSPIRQVRNALRTQIKTTENEDTSFLAQAAKNQLADIFAPMKGPDENRENCLDVELSDTVVENDVIVGEFAEDGKLINGKSVYATKSLGVGDQEHAEGFLVPARTNFPAASQYEDPYTLQPTSELDVVVDMPNESGVMLTSNSRIDGGIFDETSLAND